MGAAAAAKRRAPRAQHVSRSLWVWPCVSGAAAFVAAELASSVDLERGSTLRRMLWPGDADAARAMVQVVATSAITVTTLTFSVTVVALQLASQQFSPRLLREFTRDPVTRVILSVLIGTLVFSLTALRNFRADQPPPALALAGTYVLGLLSLLGVLAFITHIVRILRVDSMMRSVHGETTRAIEKLYSSPSREPYDGRLPVPASKGQLVLASKSGFVRLLDIGGLVGGARDADGFVEVLVRPGDHVVSGSPLALVWAGAADRVESLAEVVHEHVVLSLERTPEQDAAFGFRQLEDIAVKALSPSINDPVTASHALGHMADLLVRLAGCSLGASVHDDDRGASRVVVPDRDFRYYLELACGQLRRYARSEPTVLVALLRMLRDVAVAAENESDRAEIREQARLVGQTADEDLLDEDLASVGDLQQRVDRALAGDLLAAYADRAGETRSL